MIGAGRVLAILPVCMLACMIANAVNAANEENGGTTKAVHCPWLNESDRGKQWANIRPDDSACDKCCTGLNFKSGKLALDADGKKDCFCERYALDHVPSSGSLKYFPGMVRYVPRLAKIKDECKVYDFDNTQLDRKYIDDAGRRRNSCDECAGEGLLGVMYNGLCRYLNIREYIEQKEDFFFEQAQEVNYQWQCPLVFDESSLAKVGRVLKDGMPKPLTDYLSAALGRLGSRIESM